MNRDDIRFVLGRSLLIVASILVPLAALYLTFVTYLGCGLGGLRENGDTVARGCTAANTPIWFRAGAAWLSIGLVVATAVGALITRHRWVMATGLSLAVAPLLFLIAYR